MSRSNDKTAALEDDLARLQRTPAQYRRMRVVPGEEAARAARAAAEAKAGPMAGAPRGKIRANAPTSTPQPRWKRAELIAVGGLGLAALGAVVAAVIGIATHDPPATKTPNKPNGTRV